MERELLSRRAYAKRRGVSHTAVNNAIRTGRIAAAMVKLQDGRELVDAEAADKLWVLNTDPAQQRQAETIEAKPETKAAEHEPAAGAKTRQEIVVKPGQDLFGETLPPKEKELEQDADTGPKPGTYAFARARRENHQATLAELNARSKAKELISRDRACSLLFQLTHNCRDKLQGIGFRVAPDLAADTDPRSIQARIDSEIEAALSELADGPARL